jgi:AAA+ superfamily predicted ATPase
MRKVRKPKNVTIDNLDGLILYDLFESAYKELSSKSLELSPVKEFKICQRLSNLIVLDFIQTINLVVFVIRFESNQQILEQDIINYLSRITEFSKRDLRNAIRQLKKMGLVSNVTLEGSQAWYPKRKLIDAIDKDNLKFFKTLRPRGLENMLEFWVNNVIDSFHLSTDEIDQMVEDLSDINKDLNLIKYCNNLSIYLSSLEAACLLSICSKSLFDSRPFNLDFLERKGCYSRFSSNILRDQISDGTWIPMRDGYVKLSGGRVTKDDTRMELTEKGFRYFFNEIDAKVLKTIRKRKSITNLNLLSPKEIAPINLLFNESFGREIEKLELLLNKKNFKQYKKEFSSKTRMPGMTFLFYGEPGCGKTEFALQLARKTQRPIIKFQVTDFMSKWVGESERNLKNIFSEYRLMLEKSVIEPILFLNECDQIIGKRVNTTDSVDQMNNALQNILLEEMENFPGILIGTTNLIHNMDVAFERRWLFKVGFEHPNRSTQQNIWLSYLPELSLVQLEELTKGFNFTPGEILNVVKRYNIERIIYPNIQNIEMIKQLCSHEQFDNKRNSILGFQKSITQ